ncbi:unnamed protein product, partial [Anisakis simplex]|uniref:Ovule protein n=1 Tax=Anisakis simplex TaxID=6269 RepID=A0A0M3JI08_ANISI
MVNFGRGKRSVKREDGAEGAMGSGGESKPAKTFEDEWVSDEEADNGDMRDLLKDDFISDLRCGSVMPLVLPLSDEAQFKSLLSRSVKKEEIEVDGEQFLQTDLKAENTNSQNGSQTEK